jgi:hypothetical protein
VFTTFLILGLAGSVLLEVDALLPMVGPVVVGPSFKAEWGESVQQTADGGYIIVGQTFSFDVGDYPDVYLIMTDPEGMMAWSRTYGGPYADVGQCVRQTTDGGYIIAGASESSQTYYDVYLIKTDPEGALVWEHTYGYVEFPWMYVGIGTAITALLTITTIAVIYRKRRTKRVEPTTFHWEPTPRRQRKPHALIERVKHSHPIVKASLLLILGFVLMYLIAYAYRSFLNV